MKRRTLLALGLAGLFLAAAGFAPNAEPAEGLKLIVRLNPSNGVVPLAPAGSAIYTFKVTPSPPPGAAGDQDRDGEAASPRG